MELSEYSGSNCIKYENKYNKNTFFIDQSKIKIYNNQKREGVFTMF